MMIGLRKPSKGVNKGEPGITPQSSWPATTWGAANPGPGSWKCSRSVEPPEPGTSARQRSRQNDRRQRRPHGAARKRIRTGAQEGKTESEDAGDTGDIPWEEQRQAALQGLGERLGLPLTDIKITKSDESVFEFFLGEADSVVIPAKLLGHQHLFKDRFLEAGLIVPKKLKEPKEGGVWDEVVRQMIRLAVLQDVEPESSALGELREFINLRRRAAPLHQLLL